MHILLLIVGVTSTLTDLGQTDVTNLLLRAITNLARDKILSGKL